MKPPSGFRQYQMPNPTRDAQDEKFKSLQFTPIGVQISLFTQDELAELNKQSEELFSKNQKNVDNDLLSKYLANMLLFKEGKVQDVIKQIPLINQTEARKMLQSKILKDLALRANDIMNRVREFNSRYPQNQNEPDKKEIFRQKAAYFNFVKTDVDDESVLENGGGAVDDESILDDRGKSNEASTKVRPRPEEDNSAGNTPRVFPESDNSAGTTPISSISNLEEAIVKQIEEEMEDIVRSGLSYLFTFVGMLSARLGDRHVGQHYRYIGNNCDKNQGFRLEDAQSPIVKGKKNIREFIIANAHLGKELLKMAQMAYLEQKREARPQKLRLLGEDIPQRPSFVDDEMMLLELLDSIGAEGGQGNSNTSLPTIRQDWVFGVMDTAVFSYILNGTSLASMDMAKSMINRIPNCRDFSLKQLLMSEGVRDQFALLCSYHFLMASGGNAYAGRASTNGRANGTTFMLSAGIQTRQMLYAQVECVQYWFERVFEVANPKLKQLEARATYLREEIRKLLVPQLSDMSVEDSSQKGAPSGDAQAQANALEEGFAERERAAQAQEDAEEEERQRVAQEEADRQAQALANDERAREDYALNAPRDDLQLFSRISGPILDQFKDLVKGIRQGKKEVQAYNADYTPKIDNNGRPILEKVSLIDVKKQLRNLDPIDDKDNYNYLNYEFELLIIENQLRGIVPRVLVHYD